MWNFLRKSSDAAVDPRDARIKELEELVAKQKARAERAEAAHRIALETASQHAARIIKLEADNAEQSSKITTLSNLNSKLERELRPFRMPRPRAKNGWYLSDAQAAALARQEQAA